MFVCVCNAYRDAEICEVARSGVRCARRAYMALGGGPRCGRCLPFAQGLIDEVHGEGKGGAPARAPAAPRAEAAGAAACSAGAG